MATDEDQEGMEMSVEELYANFDDIISGLVTEKLENSGWVEDLPPGLGEIEKELDSLEDQQVRIHGVFEESERLLGLCVDNLTWQQNWFKEWKEHNRRTVSPEEMVDLTEEDDEVMVVSTSQGSTAQHTQQDNVQQQEERQEQQEMPPSQQARAEVSSVEETLPPVPEPPEHNVIVSSANQGGEASSEQPMADQKKVHVQKKAPKVSSTGAGTSQVTSELAVGMKLLGKKKDDIWYQGTLIKIVQDDNGVIRYKVKYDGKGKGLMSGNHIAFSETVGQGMLHAGSRIVGEYRDEEGDSVLYMYAGIVAELPSKANRSRYLIFFDDGYATYLRRNQIHQVCKPSVNPWEDVIHNSREFIREYLQGYPERAMVKVKVGQKIRTEWEGQWWDARVDSVDGSLVKMYYPTDQRSEWIYRGSTRLWPLYEASATQEQAQTGASKSIRSHTMGKTKGPHIEYTRADEEEAKSKSKTACAAQTAQKKPPSTSAPSASQSKPASTSAASASQSKPPSRSSTPRSIDSSNLSFERLLTEDIEKLQVPSRSSELQNSGGGMGRPAAPREALLQIATATQKKVATSQQPNTSAKQIGTTTHPPVTTFPQRPSRPLKKQVARKSTGLKAKRPFDTHYSMSREGMDIASILQRRLMDEGDSNSRSSDDSIVDITAENDPTEVPAPKTIKFYPHRCTPACVSQVRPANPDQYRGRGAWPHINPLKVPIMYQWERYIGKKRPGGTRDVSYRTPCARMVRSLREISRYLMQTNSNFLSIDQFCFDPYVMLDSMRPEKYYVKIDDLSDGHEVVPISCVNEINSEHPDHIGYTEQRLPTPGVELNLDPDFLVSCDCTDNCQNKKTCACHQLTLQASGSRPGGQEDPDAGYENRRLMAQLPTGIYECNSRCKCSKQCYNRVAQQGIGLRLQVFKTSTRGWGIRCLDDIPEGAFICIYAGQLLTEDTANKGGNMFGDEYLAELDHIEMAEKYKEGYESDVPDSSGSDMGDSDSDSDNSHSGEEPSISSSTSPEPDLDNSSDSDYKPDGTDKSKEPGGAVKLVLRRESRGSTSGRSGKTAEQWSVKPQKSDTDKKVESWLKKNQDDKKLSGDSTSQSEVSPVKMPGAEGSTEAKKEAGKDDGSAATEVKDKKEEKPDKGESPSSSKAAKPEGLEKDKKVKDSSSPVRHYGYRVDGDRIVGLKRKHRKKVVVKASSSSESEESKPKASSGECELMIIGATSLAIDSGDETSDSEKGSEKGKKKKEGGEKDMEVAVPNDPQQPVAVVQPMAVVQPSPDKSTRKYFGEEHCYVMDAKVIGNCGRYLNHSCSPNLFVQNVFVDTHDLRFPWVAFFSSKRIRGGTELTWDYSYEVGSVPDRVLYCYCGSEDCRGRLL